MARWRQGPACTAIDGPSVCDFSRVDAAGSCGWSAPLFGERAHATTRYAVITAMAEADLLAFAGGYAKWAEGS